MDLNLGAAAPSPGLLYNHTRLQNPPKPSSSNCLLHLAGLGSLLRGFALAAVLSRLGASLGVEHVVPPSERASVVADEALVVDIVVLSAGPEGEEVVQAPRELVTGVGIDGLEQAEDDPDVDGEDVKILGDGDPQNGRSYGSETKSHDFDGRGVFGGESEGRRVLVVNLVHVLVQRAPVEGTVEPVVPGILHDEEDGDLVGHLGPGGEGNAGLHAKVHAHGVEQPDLGELDSEVTEQDQLGALPLLGGRGNLGLTKI
jgi:hypothetical protein